jgi:tRNA pseudouridine(55) synthase
MSLILAFKNRTETMSVCMERIRAEADISGDIPMTYAGRLDPMAEGLVVFLSGDMRFQKEQMLKMNKTYQVEFFLGYETDAYDVLGMVQQPSGSIEKEITMQIIESFQQPGTFLQNFPAYSSRKVEGKPLFVHAKESIETNAQIPTESHSVTIYNYLGFETFKINSSSFLESIYSDIKKVEGDFRQDESIASWKKVADSFPETVTMHSIVMSVSSGFYVRQWVSDIGRFLSTGAVTFRIVRDTIGIFTMSMLNGESYRVFNEHDPLIQNLTK